MEVRSSCSFRVKSALVLVLLVFLVACNRASNDTQPSQPAVQTVVSSRPPFKTKEPERYRATRVTTSEEYSAGSSAFVTQKTMTRIFRSGVNRREEHDSSNGRQWIYLETTSGRFVLIPALNSFAELTGSAALPSEPIEDGMSEHLLRNMPVESFYQAFGSEELNGRRAVKYLVRQKSNAAEGNNRDTFVWIDDELGMPIRSESAHTEAGKTFRFVTELLEIEIDVDEKLFEIPKGFQKIEHTKLLQRIAERSN